MAQSRLSGLLDSSQKTFSEFGAMLERDRLPVAKGLVVDDDDHIRGEVIQELMCYDGLSFANFDDAFGIEFTDYFAAELERLEPMIDDGLVECDSESISITPRRPSCAVAVIREAWPKR